MKKVILDTSFIITCAKQKIDFFSDIFEMGLEILIPRQVLSELKKLSEKNESARLALGIFGKKKKMFREINLEKYGKTTDKGIINFSKENPGTIIATLDKEIKSKTLNRKMVIRSKKKLEIV